MCNDSIESLNKHKDARRETQLPLKHIHLEDKLFRFSVFGGKGAMERPHLAWTLGFCSMTGISVKRLTPFFYLF